jgi:hypothetical protein
MNVREFTVGDRLVSLKGKLWHPSGLPVVLGVAETVSFRMVLSSSGAVKVDDQACAIVSLGLLSTSTPAEVRYDWAAADVDTAGTYTGWFIRVSGGETEHFPHQPLDPAEFQIIIRPRA